MVTLYRSKFPSFSKVFPTFSIVNFLSISYKARIVIIVATQPVVCTMRRMKMRHWVVRCLAHCYRSMLNADEIEAHRLVSKTNESAHNYFALMRPVGTVWPIDRPPRVQHVAMDQ